MTYTLLRRVLARAGLGLWQQRGTLVLGAGVLGALAAYVLFFAPAPSSARPVAGANGRDCADTVMAALAGARAANQQQAYQCLDPTYQQRVSEQQFSAQALPTSGGSITHVARVGSYDAPTGATLVYYAIDTTTNQSLGFIIYLGTNGKVTTIE
jgi:hypothetical protein